MQKGSLFIVIEGLDGSGKTSISRQLANVLDYTFKGKVKLTFEPHDPSCAGLFIRQVIMKKIRNFTPRMLALAFAANRLDHCNREMNPWLDGSIEHIVICDRYYLSSLVYQHSEDLSFESIMQINEKARKPDLTFFIDVSNKVCYERIKIRNQPKELFEKNLTETRNNYFEAIEYLRKEKGDIIIEIDGSGSIEEVVEKMLNGIYDYDEGWKPRQPLISSTLIPRVFSLNGKVEITIEDIVNELKLFCFQLTTIDKTASFHYLKALKKETEKRVEAMSFDNLGSIFLDFVQWLGFKVGPKLPWTHLDCYELEYVLPANIHQRGSALLINETQRYDVIMQKSSELYQMSDFMLVFSPGPSELVTKHYERDRIQYFNANNEVAVSLFPSTQLITQKDLVDCILRLVVERIVQEHPDFSSINPDFQSELLHFSGKENPNIVVLNSKE